MAGGYSLVELLVVLAVISLLIAAAPAIVSAARPGAEARAAAYALLNDLRAARLAAIVNDVERAVVFDLAKDSYRVLPDGVERALAPRLALIFEGPQRAPDGERGEIRFFPDGSSSGGIVSIASGAKIHRIAARGLSGRISIDE